MNHRYFVVLRRAATAVVLVLLALVVLQWKSGRSASSDPALLIRGDAASAPVAASLPQPSPALSPPPIPIAVDVIGAVQQPGVYRLDPAARVEDAVHAAGYLSPDADREAINFAEAVHDGQQIRVPRIGDRTTMETAAPVDAANGLININTASATALDALPGIGPATAASIVEYRDENGGFSRVEDVQEVKGIGPSLYENIRDRITVGP